MLKIDVGKVEFNERLLLKNVTLEACGNTITTITGKSGVGKSTLIDMLTFRNKLFNHYEIGEICFDNFSDDEKQNFLFNYMGIVYQEPKFINDLSILEHINLTKKITNINEDIEATIDILELNELMHKYPNELSGGERVRFSILLSLIKNPRILILDEPTSSLDAYYTDKVIGLLKQLSNEGKLVLITSHDKKVIDASDRVYIINNNTIELSKNNVFSNNKELFLNKGTMTPDIKKVKSFFKVFNKHTKTYKKIIFILTVICIGMAAFSVAFNNIATQIQIQNINDISSNELIIYKPSGGYAQNKGVENGSINEVIFQEELDKIKEMEYVDKIEWRYDTLMTASFISLAESPFFFNPSKNNAKELYKISASLNNGKSLEANIKESNIPTVNTYLENEDYDKQIAYNFDNKGVFISKKLAKSLTNDFELLRGGNLKFSLPIPIYNSDGKARGTTEEGITYNQNLISCQWISVSMPIAGVLEASNMGITNYFDNAIYISQTEMGNYIDKYRETHDRTVYIYGDDIYSCKASIDTKPTEGVLFCTVVDSVWTPKSYSVFVNDITKIEDVVKKINKIGFNVSNEYFESTATLNSIESMQKSILYMTLSITLIILLGYMVIKFSNHNEQMNISHYFLEMGLIKTEVFKLKKVIFVHRFFTLSFLSCGVLFFVIIIANNFLRIGYTSIRISMFVVIVVLSYIVEYIIPAFIEKRYNTVERW